MSRAGAKVLIVNIRAVGIGRILELEWTEIAPGDGGSSRQDARRELLRRYGKETVLGAGRAVHRI